MADKMADKISKPLNLSAKKANIVFNNVSLYAFLPILIEASFNRLFVQNTKIY